MRNISTIGAQRLPVAFAVGFLVISLWGCNGLQYEIDRFVETRYAQKNPPPVTLTINRNGEILFQFRQENFKLLNNPAHNSSGNSLTIKNIGSSNITSLSLIASIYYLDSAFYLKNILLHKRFMLAAPLAPMDSAFFVLDNTLDNVLQVEQVDLIMLEKNGVKSEFSEQYKGLAYAYESNTIKAAAVVQGTVDIDGKVSFEFLTPLENYKIFKGIVVPGGVMTGLIDDDKLMKVDDVGARFWAPVADSLRCAVKLQTATTFDSLSFRLKKY